MTGMLHCKISCNFGPAVHIKPLPHVNSTHDNAYSLLYNLLIRPPYSHSQSLCSHSRCTLSVQAILYTMPDRTCVFQRGVRVWACAARQPRASIAATHQLHSTNQLHVIHAPALAQAVHCLADAICGSAVQDRIHTTLLSRLQLLQLRR